MNESRGNLQNDYLPTKELWFLSNGEEISNATKFKIHTNEATLQTSVRLFFRRQIVRIVVVGKGFDCKLR